ncbi:unnamed protein product, partial [Iphiclides podalirius]
MVSYENIRNKLQVIAAMSASLSKEDEVEKDAPDNCIPPGSRCCYRSGCVSIYHFHAPSQRTGVGSEVQFVPCVSLIGQLRSSAALSTLTVWWTKSRPGPT